MFDSELAQKLIEMLEPILDGDQFALLLDLIEEHYTVTDQTSGKEAVAMDRALEVARRRPRRQVAFDGRRDARPVTAEAAAKFKQMFPDAKPLVRS